MAEGQASEAEISERVNCAYTRWLQGYEQLHIVRARRRKEWGISNRWLRE
jgi:hypothetical protein